MICTAVPSPRSSYADHLQREGIPLEDNRAATGEPLSDVDVLIGNDHLCRNGATSLSRNGFAKGIVK